MAKTLADQAREMLLGGDDGPDDGYMQSLDEQVAHSARKKELQVHTERVIKLYEKGQPAYARDGLHLSDILHRKICMRKMILLHCYKQNAVIHGQQLGARFAVGVAMHDRWESILANALDLHEIEMRHIETFWRLLFTPDLIAPYEWEEGKPELTIWEFKGYKWSTLADYAAKGTLPKDAIEQNIFYQYFTGIHRGLVVVEGKGTEQVMVFPVKYDESVVLPYIPVFDKIKAATDAHMQDPAQLPPRLKVCGTPDDDTPKSCASCTSCFATIDERVPMRRLVAWE